MKAMAASIGITGATWSRYERDLSFPSQEVIWRFCGIYHVDHDWLMYGDEVAEKYKDGYQPGDPLGDPIDYELMMLEKLQKAIGRQITNARMSGRDDLFEAFIEGINTERDSSWGDVKNAD